MFFQNINYVTVAIAAVVSIGIGFIWYSPWAFYTPWARAKGRNPEEIENDVRAGMGQKGMGVAWLSTVIAALVSAFVIAALYSSLVVTSVWGMIVLALSLWIAFVVPVKLSDSIFGKESWVIFGVTTGYYLVSTLAMSLIIGIWG